MLKIMICVNPNKDKELTNTKKLLDYFKQFDVKVIMSDIFKRPYFENEPLSDTLLSGYDIEYIPEYAAFKKADLCVVFGGDGTILKIAKKASQGGAYILGMNMGRVGYLAELEINEIELLDPVLKVNSADEIEHLPDITVDSRMMLKCEIVRGGNTVFTAMALNEVVISKGAVSRMAGLQLKCNGKNIISYRADGIVISTPTGSTAYCMSAGGPIIDPGLDCVCAVPVCPYMCLNSGAVVFSGSSVIEVVFKADKLNEAFCTVDGKSTKSIYDGDVVRITKAPTETKLLRLKDIDFYTRLNEKMNLANN
ncbi:MAG: NAD(+)/NADH kinase [Ruminococcaceae bacterium]|nr:NAD(+)/NADH kinase [Oscillospiraceae bacterium]